MTSTKIILPSAGQKFGIDNLKLVLAFVLKALGMGFGIDQNNDGKVDFAEIFAAITPLTFQFPQLRESFPLLKKEFKDLDDNERMQLQEFINETLDLPMKFDDLEEGIKLTVNAVVYNVRYVGKMRALFAKDEVLPEA